MTTSSDRHVELKLKRELLDPDFGTYKLSLDSLPVYKVPFQSGIDQVKLTNAQYSYQHVKAFGLTNHLVLDSWNPDSVYFINTKWELVKACVKNNAAYVASTVFTIPEANELRQASGRLAASFQFVSASCLVLVNGAGKLYILDTGNRSGKPAWKVTYSDSVLGENQFFTLLNCTMLDGGQRLDCLLLHVDEIMECEDKSSPVRTVIEWLSFSSKDPSGWTLDRSRRLDGRTTPDYISVEKSGQALLVASEKPFKFSYDSEAVLDEIADPTDSLVEAAPSEPPVYSWSQTDDEVNVQVPLPPDTVKSDIVFKLTPESIQLEVKNRQLSMSGQLCGKVDTEASTWTIGDNILDLTITKQTAESWPSFIEGDTQGRAQLDPSQQAAIEDFASIVKSQETDADEMKQTYNAQELEECDTFPEDTAVMVRIDGETHKVTHQANISCHQWLFNAISNPDELPAICLRHDFDGIIWQPRRESPSSFDCPWEHVATFNALGYVQASKQNKKFATCPPDYSFAALCDCTHHVYVYRQPQEISSPLRNRKTGKQIGAIAKQQVFTLDNVDPILGMCASNTHLFVITSDMLYVISIS